MKKKKVKMNTKEDMSDALMSKFAIKKENTKDFYLKKNVEYMAGSVDETIGDEDWATCEALAQDGELLEDYAI